MSDEAKKWTLTTWIVYTGTPGGDDFRVLASGKTEKDAMRKAMVVGFPLGARVGKVLEEGGQ